MKKILLTGGAGYIGSVCAEYLLDRDYDVTIYDSLLSGHRAAVDKRAHFVYGDLAEREKLLELCRKEQFDAVMHFAAFSLVGESMEKPEKYFRNNLVYAINLADAAVSSGVKNFVFSSTAAVYGQPEKIPIAEEDATNPINPYGESKLAFEKVLKWYSQIHGLRYVALRYFNAAGASEQFGEDHRPESHLIPIILQVAAGKRDKLLLYGDDYPTPDGSCVRDYIHVIDLAQAHKKALDAPESGHYNLGTGNGLSVFEIIRAAEEVTGQAIKFDISPRRPGDPAQLIATSAKAKERLHWHPELESAHKIIESAWKWHLAHPNGYPD